MRNGTFNRQLEAASWPLTSRSFVKFKTCATSKAHFERMEDFRFGRDPLFTGGSPTLLETTFFDRKYAQNSLISKSPFRISSQTDRIGILQVDFVTQKVVLMKSVCVCGLTRVEACSVCILAESPVSLAQDRLPAKFNQKNLQGFCKHKCAQERWITVT